MLEVHGCNLRALQLTQGAGLSRAPGPSARPQQWRNSKLEEVWNGVESIELNGLGSSSDCGLVQRAAFQIEPGGFGGLPRKDQQTMKFLGQAFEPGRRVDRIADRSHDPRSRWSHCADDSLAEMDPNAYFQR